MTNEGRQHTIRVDERERDGEEGIIHREGDEIPLT
jgi:hypothetical protein